MMRLNYPEYTKMTESGHVYKSDCPCEQCRRMFRPTVAEQKDDHRKYHPDQPLAVRIEIEYEDGEIRRADGDDAFLIVRNIISAQVMEAIHGRPYSGPQMKKVTA